MGKGENFERTVSKLFSLWWTNGKENDIFWRTAGSGGRATVRMKKNLSTHDSAADIRAEHPDGKSFTKSCLIECKKTWFPSNYC